tara:strand:+ start:465 stop:776 length:312 start_codon:yes stop_codon:yes gene_type:complete
MSKKIWKTKKEFNKWMDAFEKQQVEPVRFQMELDAQVNALIDDGVEYAQAFDQVYTVPVLKKLNLLPQDFVEPDHSMTMTQVLSDIDENYTVMVEKSEESTTN